MNGSPMRAILALNGIGSGSSVAVVARPNCWATSSMRISFVFRVRLRASQEYGFSRTSRASSSRNPPLALCSAPGFIMLKSVNNAPNWA